jgi:hypothetical protein
LRTLKEKLVKIGARVVRHSRYVIFQMAEVAVPMALFCEILLPGQAVDVDGDTIRGRIMP